MRHTIQEHQATIICSFLCATGIKAFVICFGGQNICLRQRRDPWVRRKRRENLSRSAFTDTRSQQDHLRRDGSKVKRKSTNTCRHVSFWNCFFFFLNTRTCYFSRLSGRCFYNRLLLFFLVLFATLKKFLPAVLKQEGLKKWVPKPCGFLHFYRLSTLAATNFVYAHLRTQN